MDSKRFFISVVLLEFFLFSLKRPSVGPSSPAVRLGSSLISMRVCRLEQGLRAKQSGFVVLLGVGHVSCTRREKV